MGETTGISWTDATFNPWEGCTKVSPGCTNCYAETRNKRFGGDNWGVGKPRRRTSEANWRQPLKWNREAGRLLSGELTADPDKVRRPRVFCASLADWLDPDVPAAWLADLLALICATPNLDWQLLTKRPELWMDRMELAYAYIAAHCTRYTFKAQQQVAQWMRGNPLPNVWIGCTVEDQRRAEERIHDLTVIPAKVRFLSMEPLLEQVDLGLWLGDYDCHACNRRFWGDDGSRMGLKAVGFRCDEDCTSTDGTCECSVEVCPHCQTDNGDGNSNATVGPRSDSDEEYHPTGIHWVIVGGESGTKARPFNLGWARSIVQQCKAAGVAVFVKQMGDLPVNPLSMSAGGEGLRLPAYKAHHGADPSEWPEDLRVQEFPG